MKKMAIVLFVFFAMMISAQTNVSSAENQKPTQWYFLMVGASGGFSTDVFVQAGPFKDEATCKETAKWAEKNRAKTSQCWPGITQ